MTDNIQQLNKQPIRILLRRGTQANVLASIDTRAGEPGYSTDTNVLYVSNGTTPLPMSGHLQRTAVADAAYSALVTDHLIAYTTLTAPRTVTLPTAVGTLGQVIVVKDETGNAGTQTITVAAQAGQTIDGAASKAITTAYGSLRVYSTGAAWFMF